MKGKPKGMVAKMVIEKATKGEQKGKANAGNVPKARSCEQQRLKERRPHKAIMNKLLRLVCATDVNDTSPRWGSWPI